MKTSINLRRTALFITALAIIAAVSCKKSTDPFSQPGSSFNRKSGGNIPVFTTVSEINEHLKWIARGFAHWKHPDHLVRKVDSLINLPGNDSTMHAISYLNTLYGFDTAHNDTIDARFLGNSYDSDGLGAFEYENETYFTDIYIPEDYYWESKPFVVVPEKVEEDSNTTNSALGYFPKAGGGIDSVTITDLNEDDYYIWVVDYYTYKDFILYESQQGDSLVRKSGVVEVCNGDNVCDPAELFQPNCTDCYPLPPQKYRLEITEIEIFRDNCPRAEKFLGGQYEFAVTYGLYDGAGTSSLNKGEINSYYNDIVIKTLNRKHVCREKCIVGGSKGRCPSHVYSVNYVLYEEFTPASSPCVMPFILSEYDDVKQIPSQYEHPWYELRRGAPHYYTGKGYFHPYYFTGQAAYIASGIDLYAMWQANNHNGSSQWLGNNEVKIKLELIKL